ncbi:replication protein, partial [Acinetobacter pittii]|nr:replication protein [Acinetobacter pittii]
EVLNIWKPDLQQLNSWMQRSGLPKISQAQVDELLLEINPHYENKIITGAVTSTQMYSNFVKWVKRDYNLVERLFQQASSVAQNINPSELKADMGDW